MHHRCGMCQEPTEGPLHDCPCRLGPECPIRGGLCSACASIVARNAGERDGTVAPRTAAYARSRVSEPIPVPVRRARHLRAV